MCVSTVDSSTYQCGYACHNVVKHSDQPHHKSSKGLSIKLNSYLKLDPLRLVTIIIKIMLVDNIVAVELIRK